MKYNEKKGNLFELDDKYYFAHCISSDAKMGAGIAVQFQKKFGLRRKILANGYAYRKHPTCIKVGRVFNLITKELYWYKPTYNTLRGALKKMKEIIVEEDIHYLAMPKIGSGLDKLSWEKVREIIKEVFNDVNIEIEVRYL